MRGPDDRSGSLFAYGDIEARVSSGQPLRRVCDLVNGALARLDGQFERLYSSGGRPSIAPGRQLMGRPDFDSLFRWLVGLDEERPATGMGRAARPGTGATARTGI